jgi:G8 domain
MIPVLALAFLSSALSAGLSAEVTEAPLVRSAASGRWSEATTWEGARVPARGARVQIRTGHVVTFDIKTDGPIRSIHVAGTLRFDPQRDTRLDVGLIKIQAGDDAGESGFDCENHVTAPDPAQPRPALEIGTPDQPISAEHTALIRLTAVAGLDPEECPAIVCCGGRWDVHGSPLGRSWVKLGAPAQKGSSQVTLAEPVAGWRAGDRVIVTATQHHFQRYEAVEPASIRERHQTEERTIRAVDGLQLTLDRPLDFKHFCEKNRRGEVANLSRNAIVESADPAGARGHTMYHRYSAGSISSAEFRHLGKEGKLGKYSLHFHRVGDTMRGSSVVGASIWDSANRWITIHGTNTLVVRDCVGYQSTGHGFFLEDGTEVENILDHNLAVQALSGKPLPGQVFAPDQNDGAGFWWANSYNAFIGNVAVECERYGFRFDAPEVPGVELVRPVRFPDGHSEKVDIRTLSFLRFESNEAHSQRRYGVNLGSGAHDKPGTTGGVGEVGPDDRHPFLIQDLSVWEAHWGLTPAGPGVLVDGLDVAECNYGLWRAHYDRQAYRRLTFFRTRFPAGQGVGRQPDQSVYPSPLNPVDDRPPVTVMTYIGAVHDGRVTVRGSTVDDGTVQSVRVNGREARSLAPNFLRWEVTVEQPVRSAVTLTASARDAAGNMEQVPHSATIALP